MKKNEFIIGFLIVIISILGINIVDLQAAKQNNFNSVIVQSKKEKILFTGDSITDRYDLENYFHYDNKVIINSGIGGYKTTNILSRFHNMIEQYHADKLFLMIGTNDLGAGNNKDEIVENIQEIIAKTKTAAPTIKVYYETIYPINSNIKKQGKRTNKDIKYINEKMKEYCESNDIIYLDVYSLLIDEDGNLNEEYTEDGLHLNDKGYEVVTNCLQPYIEE